jgi:hypothetical protein
MAAYFNVPFAMNTRLIQAIEGSNTLITTYISTMQAPHSPSTPNEDVEASIPTTETVSDDPHGPNPSQHYPTFTLRRKAAKRILPWDLPVDEIQLALPRPQDADEYIREVKRRRLEEEPVPTSADEPTNENGSHDTAVTLPPTAAAAAERADSDPVTYMHPTVSRRCWTPEEDAKLTSAVTNTLKKKRGKEYKLDWFAISAWVPGRTRVQCRDRWHTFLLSNIDPTTARTRTGKWTSDEDTKLKNAVRTHGSKNWVAIAALVPGRTRIQCNDRWREAYLSNIDPTTARTGEWTSDEDTKLKNAVQTHGGKKWVAIAALVPGRTRNMCYSRWYNFLDPSIDRANIRTGTWDEDEDIKLKNAVRTHGNDWALIAVLISGRTKRQCGGRWRNFLAPNRRTIREEERDALNKASAL